MATLTDIQRLGQIRDYFGIASESIAGGIVIDADAPVGEDPPPRLADLEPHIKSCVQLQPDRRPGDLSQILHRSLIRRGQQAGGRIPAGQRRIAIGIPLGPFGGAMRRQQFVRKRGDRLEAENPALLEQIAVPACRRDIERGRSRIDNKCIAAGRLQPEVVAHSQIVDDLSPITERPDIS